MKNKFNYSRSLLECELKMTTTAVVKEWEREKNVEVWTCHSRQCRIQPMWLIVIQWHANKNFSLKLSSCWSDVSMQNGRTFCFVLWLTIICWNCKHPPILFGSCISLSRLEHFLNHSFSLKSVKTASISVPNRRFSFSCKKSSCCNNNNGLVKEPVLHESSPKWLRMVIVMIRERMPPRMPPGNSSSLQVVNLFYEFDHSQTATQACLVST